MLASRSRSRVSEDIRTERASAFTHNSLDDLILKCKVWKSARTFLSELFDPWSSCCSLLETVHSSFLSRLDSSGPSTSQGCQLGPKVSSLSLPFLSSEQEGTNDERRDTDTRARAKRNSVSERSAADGRSGQKRAGLCHQAHMDKLHWTTWTADLFAYISSSLPSR